jgi:hypothetical protein
MAFEKLDVKKWKKVVGKSSDPLLHPLSIGVEQKESSGSN